MNYDGAQGQGGGAPPPESGLSSVLAPPQALPFSRVASSHAQPQQSTNSRTADNRRQTAALLSRNRTAIRIDALYGPDTRTRRARPFSPFPAGDAGVIIATRRPSGDATHTAGLQQPPHALLDSVSLRSIGAVDCSGCTAAFTSGTLVTALGSIDECFENTRA
jgi:hypothetical protein